MAKVTGEPSPLFAREVVECVGEARAPTREELLAVAARIGRDAGMRPIFTWDGASPGPEESFLIRAAQLALCGGDGATVAPQRLPGGLPNE